MKNFIATGLSVALLAAVPLGCAQSQSTSAQNAAADKQLEDLKADGLKHAKELILTSTAESPATFGFTTAQEVEKAKFGAPHNHFLVQLEALSKWGGVGSDANNLLLPNKSLSEQTVVYPMIAPNGHIFGKLELRFRKGKWEEESVAILYGGNADNFAATRARLMKSTGLASSEFFDVTISCLYPTLLGYHIGTQLYLTQVDTRPGFVIRGLPAGQPLKAEQVFDILKPEAERRIKDFAETRKQLEQKRP